MRRRVKLKEVCREITVGYVGPMADQYVNNGIPFLRSQNVRPYRFDPSNLKFVTDEFHSRLHKSALSPGDAVVVRTGAYVGNACVVPEHLTVANCADLVILRPSEYIDSYYLVYLFNSTWGKSTIAGSLVGAAQQHFNVGVAKEMEITLPPVKVQRRIASILSSYDGLIENNTRRIKILEEMSQMLYREWFVSFRFPGHEKAQMVESELGLIPEGWSVQRMDFVADVIDCLHSKKPDHVDGGPGLLLQLFNIADGGKLDLNQQYRITQEMYEQWTSRIEVQGGDCVVTNVGRIGAVAQVPTGLRAAIGRNMTAIRPRRIGPTYLIEYLLSPHMASEVSLKKDAGTIMDSLNVKGIIKLNVPIPSGDILNQFERIARPMRRRVELLVAQNTILRTTRDFLLPKLISGEIPIEAAHETAADLVEASA